MAPRGLGEAMRMPVGGQGVQGELALTGEPAASERRCSVARGTCGTRGPTWPQPCGSDTTCTPNCTPCRLLLQRPLETTGLGLDAGDGQRGSGRDRLAGRRGAACDHGLTHHKGISR